MAGVAGLREVRPHHVGLAQDTASPAASPLATPGPLGLLAGSPPAAGVLLGRDGGTCKGRLEPCSGSENGWDECCSHVCAFSLRRNVYECT